MLETLLSPVSVDPGQFSDDAIEAIIRVLAVAGDQPIAQMAAYIRDLRNQAVPICSRILENQRKVYDQLLCKALHSALTEVRAIDPLGRLDLRRLRGLR